jgi:hypothetical protein
MGKSNQSPLQRINRIITFKEKRGLNSEMCNKVKRNILKISLSKLTRNESNHGN